MKIILAIAAGGALGAVARHFVNNQITHWLGDGFPWGILVANVAGSFAIGVLAESMALAWSPSQELRAFMIVGGLGAFTTFSTFSLQVVLLYERGQKNAYETITFARFNLEWLADGKDKLEERTPRRVQTTEAGHVP